MKDNNSMSYFDDTIGESLGLNKPDHKDTPIRCNCPCHKLNENLWSMLTEEPNCCDEARDKWLKEHPNYLKPIDQKPIWEVELEKYFDTHDLEINCEGGGTHLEQIIHRFKEVEKAAYERGKAEGSNKESDRTLDELSKWQQASKNKSKL